MFLYYSPKTAIAACVFAAMFSMGNMAYDATMINQLLLSENFWECEYRRPV